jgi:Kef-type K+ transport system membrane component KefB
MVRGVMSAVVLKLFVLGTAAFLYLYISGEQKSVNALFIGMALYLVYTWLEVKISMQLNPPKNGGN